MLSALLRRSIAITKHNLTMPGAQNRKIMRQVIRDGNNYHIRWGLNAVLQWKNDILPQPLFHLHGTRDEVFPFRRTSPTHIIPKEGHMFLMNRPDTVNQILDDILSPFQNRTPLWSKPNGKTP